MKKLRDGVKYTHDGTSYIGSYVSPGPSGVTVWAIPDSSHLEPITVQGMILVKDGVQVIAGKDEENKAIGNSTSFANRAYVRAVELLGSTRIYARNSWAGYSGFIKSLDPDKSGYLYIIPFDFKSDTYKITVKEAQKWL